MHIRSYLFSKITVEQIVQPYRFFEMEHGILSGIFKIVLEVEGIGMFFLCGNFVPK